MKVNRKWLGVVVGVLLVGVLVFGAIGTGAWFFDTETSGDNLFTAGTLDLQVNGADDPIVPITLGDMKPCDGVGGAEHCTIKYNYTFSNVGSIPGRPWIEIVGLEDYENCRNEPEKVVDGTGGCPGLGAGELSANLFLQINAPGNPGFMYPHAAGCIAGGMLCPVSTWANLGPLGKTDNPNKWPQWPVIGPQSSLAPMVLEFQIPCSVGNEIQSDSVEFDIVFHLDQIGMP